MFLRLALALAWLAAFPAYSIATQPAQASVETLLQEAKDLQNRRDFPGAIQKYQEAIKLRPTADLYEKLGLACFLANSYSQGAEAFSTALRLEPHRWVSQLFLGESLYKLNRFQAALPHVTTALDLNPKQNEARYWLGCIDHALGRFDQAIDQLNKALAAEPDNVDILYDIAETYFDYSTVMSYRANSGAQSTESRAKIEQQISAAASNASTDEDSWHNAFRLMEADADRYSMVLNSDPDAPLALSLIYGVLGQLTAERLWKLSPGSYQSHELLGQSYEHQTNHEAALAEYRLALQINPNAPGVNYEVGHAAWELKQFTNAIPALERELALNPNHASANYVLGHIYVHSDPQQLDKAVLYLTRAITANPNYASARKELGRALSLTHKDQAAIQQLELAATEDPRDEGVHYLLANLYRKTGQQDKARKELDTFNQLRGVKHIDNPEEPK